MVRLDFFEKDVVLHFGTVEFVCIVLMGFGSDLYPSYGLKPASNGMMNSYRIELKHRR
jgi:hypothetical protein